MAFNKCAVISMIRADFSPVGFGSIEGRIAAAEDSDMESQNSIESYNHRTTQLGRDLESLIQPFVGKAA